jgi:Uma2 family endonuclease
MRPAKTNATYEDVLDSPESAVAELIDGDLYLSPRPMGPHQSVATGLIGLLYPRFSHGGGGDDGWVLLDEPQLNLDGRILVPDLAGWRASRMPSIPDHFTLAPDWVCEIASRSTHKLDRTKKLPIYAASGVAHAWLIHPVLRSLTVLRLHGGHWIEIGFHEGDERVRAAPFESFELELGRLWWGLATHASESEAMAAPW